MINDSHSDLLMNLSKFIHKLLVNFHQRTELNRSHGLYTIYSGWYQYKLSFTSSEHLAVKHSNFQVDQRLREVRRVSMFFFHQLCMRKQKKITLWKIILVVWIDLLQSNKIYKEKVFTYQRTLVQLSNKAWMKQFETRHDKFCTRSSLPSDSHFLELTGYENCL